jgi:hypothetical protein
MALRRSSTAVLLAGLASCKHHAGPDYFGKHVMPPRGLDVLRPGMEMADARAALPGIDQDGDVSSGVDDVQLRVVSEHGIVTSMYALYEGAARPGFDKLLADAWGAPHGEPAAALGGKAVWEDASTGWRAELLGDFLYFSRMLTPEFFGKPAHPFGALASLTSSATYPEAKALLPNGRDVTAEPLSVEILKRGTALSFFHLILAPHAKDILMKAWGSGVEVKPHPEDQIEKAWFALDDGWRAFLENVGTNYVLESRPSCPLTSCSVPGQIWRSYRPPWSGSRSTRWYVRTRPQRATTRARRSMSRPSNGTCSTLRSS